MNNVCWPDAVFCSDMKMAKRLYIRSIPAVLLTAALFLAPATAESDGPPEITEPVRAEVEKLGDRHAAYGAAQELAARGREVVPELFIALEDTLTSLAEYDPKNLGTAEADYSALLYRQAQLLGLIGTLGGADHVDRLIAIAGLMRSENIVAASYFATIEALGAHQKADALAAQIIANPDSDDFKLFAAMVRFSLRTPAEVADDAGQHMDKSLGLVRGAAYQLLINAGRGHEIKDRLIEEVDRLEYTGAANHQMLQLLALLEEPSSFEPRIEALRLLPKIKNAAILSNRFTWFSGDDRIAMLSEMLNAGFPDVEAMAIGFMLRGDRVDLLKEHRLVQSEMRLFEYYEMVVPGFAEMTRDRLLQHMSAEEAESIVQQRSQPLTPVQSPKMELALNRLGYRLEKRGSAIVIIPPDDEG